MIFLLAYILLPFNLLNLVDKPIEVDNNKDQIYVIISGPSCHECLLHVGEWTSHSKMEITAVMNGGIEQVSPDGVEYCGFDNLSVEHRW